MCIRDRVVIGSESAVSYAVEKRLSPIPSGMEAYHPPEIAGAAQNQAEQYPEADHGQQSELALARIEGMSQSEQ